MTMEIEGVPASVTRQQIVDLLATLVLVRRLLPADALAVQVRPPGPRGASDQRQDRRRDVSEQLVAATTYWQPRSGRVVFLDTETTGLDPATEQVFEIATICGVTGAEQVWHVEPYPEVVERMHPKAAEVNRYHERTAEPDWVWHSPHRVADELRKTLTGAHIVGAVPDFDARFLTAWYTHMLQDVPRWHYHLIDIENLAYGWMLREPLTAQERNALASLPWDSDALSQMCGVEPVPEHERHTALGDARWVARWWNRLHGHSGSTGGAT